MGARWPSSELTSRLLEIASSAGASVTNKPWTKAH